MEREQEGGKRGKEHERIEEREKRRI